MELKINTKEKFIVITPVTPVISDNNADEIVNTCKRYLEAEIRNIVLNLEAATDIEEKAANTLMTLQQEFYENNASFVLCELKPQLENAFEQFDLLDLLNITPTESEAWDIVQMEEIERELLDGEDF